MHRQAAAIGREPGRRQRLPASASCTIAVSAGSPPWWKANIAMTKPGVQKPHWVASASTSACCTGWSAPSGPARPSTVRTAQLSICGSIIRQEFTAWNCNDPSTRRPRTMVQAPQSPSAQPSLVPVRCTRVRSQSSTVMLGGALSSLHGVPFNRNRTAVMLASSRAMGAQPRYARACSLPLEDNGPRAAWGWTRRQSSGRRGDHLDLDQEFGPRKSGDDHQRGGRRRIADVEVAHAHVAPQVLARDDEGIDANHVGEREGGFLEHDADIAETEVRLLLDGSRHLVVGRDAEL